MLGTEKPDTCYVLSLNGKIKVVVLYEHEKKEWLKKNPSGKSKETIFRPAIANY